MKKILDINDENFAEDFVAAIGAKPGDSISIATPQFERVDGVIVKYFPKTTAEFEALKMLSSETLLKFGLALWEDVESKIHWLYPGEWYSSIPEGHPVVSISGRKFNFVSGKSDDDIRFGSLSFGFVQVKH